MDIAQTSRAYFAQPSPTAGEKISLTTNNTVYTYHCLCSHLLLATTTPLPSLPCREHSHDKAHIMPLRTPTVAPARGPPAPAQNDHHGLLLSTRLDPNPEIVTSDQGFEKRYLQRCGRCNLTVGYQLDWQQFEGDKTGRREDTVYLIPGGFVRTSDMIKGKMGSQGGITVGVVTEVKSLI